MKKKVLALLLAGAMCLGLTACGGENQSPRRDRLVRAAGR